jgi:3',5'-cyclic-AMP phosphodiesterase
MINALAGVVRNSRNVVALNMRIIQITDTHLLKNSDDTYCDLLPDVNLKKLIDHICKNDVADMFLLTGDLSEDGSVESYQRLVSIVEPLPNIIYRIPGNHDDVLNFEKHMQGENISRDKVIDFPFWRIVLLNSVDPGKSTGLIDKEELAFLRNSIADAKDKSVMVVLHHHPVFVTQGMEKHRLEKSDQFLQVIANHDNVKAVIFGHIHRPFYQKINHCDFYGSPASSMQCSPNDVKNYIISREPAYRWFELADDGGLASGVVQLEA